MCASVHSTEPRGSSSSIVDAVSGDIAKKSCGVDTSESGDESSRPVGDVGDARPVPPSVDARPAPPRLSLEPRGERPKSKSEPPDASAGGPDGLAASRHGEQHAAAVVSSTSSHSPSGSLPAISPGGSATLAILGSTAAASRAASERGSAPCDTDHSAMNADVRQLTSRPSSSAAAAPASGGVSGSVAHGGTLTLVVDDAVLAFWPREDLDAAAATVDDSVVAMDAGGVEVSVALGELGLPPSEPGLPPTISFSGTDWSAWRIAIRRKSWRRRASIAVSRSRPQTLRPPPGYTTSCTKNELVALPPSVEIFACTIDSPRPDSAAAKSASSRERLGAVTRTTVHASSVVLSISTCSACDDATATASASADTSSVTRAVSELVSVCWLNRAVLRRMRPPSWEPAVLDAPGWPSRPPRVAEDAAAAAAGSWAPPRRTGAGASQAEEPPHE